MGIGPLAGRSEGGGVFCKVNSNAHKRTNLIRVQREHDWTAPMRFEARCASGRDRMVEREAVIPIQAAKLYRHG